MTDDEIDRPFPCDAWIESPTLTAWRGVTVHASAENLWPWLTQVRVAPYSYDWVDNLGRHSPRTLLDLRPPIVGEHFTCAGGKKLGRILAVEESRQLTARIAGAVMSYVLEQPRGHTATRLLLKVISKVPRPLAPLLSAGDLVMARRQLLNWKHLAEQTSRR